MYTYTKIVLTLDGKVWYLSNYKLVTGNYKYSYRTLSDHN